MNKLFIIALLNAFVGTSFADGVGHNPVDENSQVPHNTPVNDLNGLLSRISPAALEQNNLKGRILDAICHSQTLEQELTFDQASYINLAKRLHTELTDEQILQSFESEKNTYLKIHAQDIFDYLFVAHDVETPEPEGSTIPDSLGISPVDVFANVEYHEFNAGNYILEGLELTADEFKLFRNAISNSRYFELAYRSLPRHDVLTERSFNGWKVRKTNSLLLSIFTPRIIFQL
jgi:hypothetical protein